MKHAELRKNATSLAERSRIIKGAILAAAAAAAVGAVSRDSKAKKDRMKAMDPYGNKNAIVVPVKKSKFMEGLPTPSELAKSRGEGHGELPPPAEAGMVEDKNGPAELSADQIASMKKDILRNRARSINFFGKRAEESSDKEVKHSPKTDKSSPETKEATKEKGENGRVFFRDESGKFVSPTDPVAVEQVAKEAFDKSGGFWDGIVDFASNPIEFAKGVGKASVGKPVLVTAGGLASLYLAAKITDAINERRRRRSKERLDEARNEYVSLVQGAEEKTANAQETIGRYAGYAFFVPAALTAIITNKIIENRKEEKKKAKEEADSYPEEPAILYKTSEGKDLKIDAETALMGLMFKQAMIMDVESMEAEDKLEKTAVLVPILAANAARRLINRPRNGDFSDDEINAAVDYTVGHMTDEGKRGKLLNLVKAYNGDPKAKGYREGIQKAIGDMIPTGPHLGADNILGIGYGAKGLPSVGGSRMTPERYMAIMNDPRARARLASSQKLQDAVIGNFANNDEWIKYKNDQIDDYSSNSWGLQKGGILHRILSWIAKNLGIGDWMANRGIRNRFKQEADKYNGIQAKRDQEAAEAAESQRQQDENSFDQREYLGHQSLRDAAEFGQDEAVQDEIRKNLDNSKGPTKVKAELQKYEETIPQQWRRFGGKANPPQGAPQGGPAPSAPSSGNPAPAQTSTTQPPVGQAATGAPLPASTPAAVPPSKPTTTPAAETDNVLAPFSKLLPWQNW